MQSFKKVNQKRKLKSESKTKWRKDVVVFKLVTEFSYTKVSESLVTIAETEAIGELHGIRKIRTGIPFLSLKKARKQNPTLLNSLKC